MMRYITCCALLVLCLTGSPRGAQAEDTPVLVELFTSQGCSACPPADALLRELATREGVLPLSLHVDYWDYIGWKDSFAQARFTARQKAYARAGHRRSVYTPQMIIGGQDAVVGHEAMDVVMAIDKHRQIPAGVSIARLAGTGGSIRVQLSPRVQLTGPSDIHLVRFDPRARVDVRRGENAGARLEYANVVREWVQLGSWDGRGAELSLDLPGEEAALLIVQAQGHGRVLGLKRLK